MPSFEPVVDVAEVFQRCGNFRRRAEVFVEQFWNNAPLHLGSLRFYGLLAHRQFLDQVVP